MSVRDALRAALRDFYSQSWRLLALNAALSAAVGTIAAAAIFVSRAALLLLVLVGPIVAALAHCAVTLQQTEELRLHQALEGLRLHWRRGLELAALDGAVVLVGTVAFLFYTHRGLLAWALSMVVLYLLFLFAIYQLLLWPIAVAEPDRRLRDAAAHALHLLLRRPAPTLGLGVAILLVNVAGLAAAAMPFLTLTVAYTFLVAAHYVRPRPTAPEASV